MAEDELPDGVHVEPRWGFGTPPGARTVGVSIDRSGFALDREGVDDLIARLAAARHQTWPAAGPMTRRECPLPSCSWYHDEPDWPLSMAVVPVPTPEQRELARQSIGAADPLREANLAALIAETQRIEAILREHFAEHPLEDWVLEVVRLQAALKERTDA